MNTHSITRPAIRVGCGLAAAALLAGCSGANQSTSATARTEAASFCSTIGRLQTAMVRPKSDSKITAGLLTVINNVTPRELAKEVSRLAHAAATGHRDGALESAFSKIGQWIATNCEVQVLKVAFDGKTVTLIPSQVRPGLTVIEFAAEATTQSAVLLRKANGVTERAADIMKLPQDQRRFKVAYAMSGEPAGVGELKPGGYVVEVGESSGRTPLAVSDLDVN